MVGAIAAGIAGASYAFYTVLGSQLVEQKHQATDALAAAFSIGALFLLPFLIADSTWLSTTNGIALALWLGLISTTLAYFMFGIGITHLAPGVVATLLLSEPAVATVLGVFVLNEPMATRGWIGCALIVAGLILVSTSERKHSKSDS
jgi:DME family drug/metabolite transporter